MTKTPKTTKEPELTRLPHACSMCEDGDAAHVLHLHARCHVQAPLRLAYLKRGDQRLVAVSCYIPSCSRPVAAFGVDRALDVSAIDPTPDTAAERSVPPCDLCGDNDPRWFLDVSSRKVREFTAPFSLEMHRTGDDRVLHVRCYVDACRRLLAVLALTPDAPRGADA